MQPILAGIETEYGLWIEGRGAEQQVEDSAALVRSYSGESFDVWDYRFESPRADLRGFKLDHLARDPIDAQFDSGKPIREEHANRVLNNGARFYNDHGHPEFSTPETWSLAELELHDLAGEIVVQRAADTWSQRTGHQAKIYKNNTDFHGSSYGTHENFLVPRSVGVDRLVRAILPVLVARPILTGAGKVCAKSTYQISQRADFFIEPVNAETLFRRPIFNTRDEPHADASQWIRLHVISGDANMISACTRRKAALIKIAISLLEMDHVPAWRLSDPVTAIQHISQATNGRCRIELEGSNWTEPDCILDSYLTAALKLFDANDPYQKELMDIASESLMLLESRTSDPDNFRKSVDWAAKKWVIEEYRREMNLHERDPALQAVDLAYHDLDENEGLYFGLLDAGEVVPRPPLHEVQARLHLTCEDNRAAARSFAVRRFSESLVSVSWGCLRFQTQSGEQDVALDPSMSYPRDFNHPTNVEEFIHTLKRHQ